VDVWGPYCSGEEFPDRVRRIFLPIKEFYGEKKTNKTETIIRDMGCVQCTYYLCLSMW